MLVGVFRKRGPRSPPLGAPLAASAWPASALALGWRERSVRDRSPKAESGGRGERSDSSGVDVWGTGCARAERLTLSTPHDGASLCARLHPALRPPRATDHPWCVDTALRAHARARSFCWRRTWPLWIAAFARADVPVVVVCGPISDARCPLSQLGTWFRDAHACAQSCAQLRGSGRSRIGASDRVVRDGRSVRDPPGVGASAGAGLAPGSGMLPLVVAAARIRARRGRARGAAGGSARGKERLSRASYPERSQVAELARLGGRRVRCAVMPLSERSRR